MSEHSAFVIGGGAREHELARIIAASEDVKKVFVTPGNAGTAVIEKVENLPFGATDLYERGQIWLY